MDGREACIHVFWTQPNIVLLASWPGKHDNSWLSVPALGSTGYKLVMDSCERPLYYFSFFGEFLVASPSAMKVEMRLRQRHVLSGGRQECHDAF